MESEQPGQLGSMNTDLEPIRNDGLKLDYLSPSLTFFLRFFFFFAPSLKSLLNLLQYCFWGIFFGFFFCFGCEVCGILPP